VRNRIFVLPLAASLVFLSGCEWSEFGPSEKHVADFHHSYPLKSGGRLSLENFNGSVEIAGWDQEMVDISGQKYARSLELLDAIKIDIVSSGDSIQIRTLRPSERRGNMGATYLIKAPRRVQLDRIVSSNGGIRVHETEGAVRLRTSNGGIRTANLKGDLEAQTSNGGVEVRNLEGGAIVKTSNGRVKAEGVRGAFEATTSNGGINVQLGGSESGRAIRLGTSNGGVELTLNAANRNDVRVSTSNGGITLRLPAAIGARVRASTSNSSISTDFDVKMQSTIGKNHLEGVIGAGGPLFDLSTTNGHIRLAKM